MKVDLNWVNNFTNIPVDNKDDLDSLIKKFINKSSDIKELSVISDANDSLIVTEITNKEKSGKGFIYKTKSKENSYESFSLEDLNIGELVATKIFPKDEIKDGIDSSFLSLKEIGFPKDSLTEKEINNVLTFANKDAKAGDNLVDILFLNHKVLETDLTPDRVDLLSILGNSYDFASLTGNDINLEKTTLFEKNNNIELENNIGKKLFSAAISVFELKDIDKLTTPLFIKNFLRLSGYKSKNFFEDISLYYQLLFGQTIQLFDVSDLDNNFNISFSNENEDIHINGNEVNLEKNDIVLKNNNKILGLAGIETADDFSISKKTKKIAFASFSLEPESISITSRRNNIKNLNSSLLEKKSDIDVTQYVVLNIDDFLSRYDNFSNDGFIFIKNFEEKNKFIDISIEKINKIIGNDLSREDIETSLNLLNIPFSFKNDNFIIEKITRRPDINIKEDVVEEILRIYGFENLHDKDSLSRNSTGNLTNCQSIERKITDVLIGMGLNENINYSLIDSKDNNIFFADDSESIDLINPVNSKRNQLRKTLLPGLLESLEYNIRRRNVDISIFEIGNVFIGDLNNHTEEKNIAGLFYYDNSLINEFNNPKKELDFYLLKGKVEDLISGLSLDTKKLSFERLSKNNKSFHPGQSSSIFYEGILIGKMGKINPFILNNFLKKHENIFMFELNQDKIIKIIENKQKQGHAYSHFPSVSKDISFIIDNKISNQEIINVINKNGENLFLEDVILFDKYIDDNLPSQKSLAYRLVFKNNERTLTDEEINNNVNTIVNNLINVFNVKMK